LQEVYGQLRDLKTEIVAVSPNTPDWAAKTVEEYGYAFPILADVGLEMAEAYNLKYRVDEKTEEGLRKFLGTELDTYNAEGGWHLPVPATYIINSSGEIEWVYANVQYKQRPSGEHILEMIEHLN